MRNFSLLGGFCLLMFACKSPETSPSQEDPKSFAEIASIDLGNAGASEISAYDPISKRLFIVNNQTSPATNRIDVVDFSNVYALRLETSIDVSQLGAANSVAVKGGKLAVALEASAKQAAGKVAFYDTKTLALLRTVAVGALPDMVTFTPDGKYVLTANEGEPDATYAQDPEGSVSIISTEDYSVTTAGFEAFAGQASDLKQKGFRIFGLNASFTQDIEPEYITVADDSKTAWVTLQENNAIAKLDLVSKTFTAIYPLGFKNHALEENAIDASDKDNAVAFKTRPVMGMYQPDAIAYYFHNGTPYLLTANEGDARDYTAFKEETSVKGLTLNAAKFPNATELKVEASLGRLTVTNTMQKNAQNEYEALYAFGARSMSVWNGLTGDLVYDTGNELERALVNALPAHYDDSRSDNKGVEPEGITVGKVGEKTLAFVGLERADAIMVYDITNPQKPVFLNALPTCDAPEGTLFIPASESPTGKSLFVASCENDGVVRVYEPKLVSR